MKKKLTDQQDAILSNSEALEQRRKEIVQKNLTETRNALAIALPLWSFEFYGSGGIACYPPATGEAAYAELHAIAPISAVCGPFYVVSHLRQLGNFLEHHPLCKQCHEPLSYRWDFCPFCGKMQKPPF